MNRRDLQVVLICITASVLALGLLFGASRRPGRLTLRRKHIYTVSPNNSVAAPPIVSPELAVPLVFPLFQPEKKPMHPSASSDSSVR